MLVPAAGCLSLEIEAARRLMAQSTTLWALLGASSVDTAMERIYPFILDDDPDSDGFMSRPRVLIGEMRGIVADRNGMDSTSARGELMTFLELDELSDADLRTKYSLASDAAVTIADHRRDLTNGFGLITQECLNAIATVGQTGGILEVQRIEMHACGLADPSKEKGDRFFVMIWVLHFEGAL